MIGISKRQFVHVLQILLPLVITSCSYEYPRDLRLEQVYVADSSAIPVYKLGAEQGFVQPVSLIIELSTTDTFPDDASVVNGFCGERLRIAQIGDGRLYRATALNGEAVSGGTTREWSNRRRYFAIVHIASSPRLPPPEWPTFDLNNDRRDICLNTGAGSGYVSQRSNEVRVPRSLIDKALNEPPRPSVPLSPNR